MESLSLFSGAGGMDVGFKDAGFSVVAANELDKYACQTFRKNHPDTQLLEGDIDQLENELSTFKGVDVIFGGPPCQGFSVAGRMDPKDPRSKLIFSFCSTVELLKPQAFVMENVKSLGSLAKFSEVRNSLISRFQEAGYQVTMHTLNAKDFGIPQSRERVFFIGVKKELAPIKKFHFDQYLKEAPSLRDILVPLGKPGSSENTGICNAKVTLAAKPVLRKSPYAGMLFNGQGRPLNPNGWASTLPASMGGNRTPILDEEHLYNGKASWVEEYHEHLLAGGKPQKMHEAPAHLRRLTITEASLLQSFPKSYKFLGPNSRIYSQIGNAVPCGLANVVAQTVMESIKGRLMRSEPKSKRKGINLELDIV